MDQRAAFLSAILDDPHDETTRLVFADWLEDQGESARAELLRKQLVLDRIYRTVPMLDDWHWMMFRRVLLDFYDDWGCTWVDYTWKQRERLRMTHDEALDIVQELPDVERLIADNWKQWTRSSKRWVSDVGFRGGLLERARVGSSKLAKDGARIFSAAPILDLTIDGAGADLPELLQLPELARLTDLHIAGCRAGSSDEGLVGRAIAGAKHLTRLRSLWLERCGLRDGGLAHLAGAAHLASLRELHLEGNSFTEKGIRSLTSSHFTRLEQLYLNGSWNIGRAGAKRLAAWPGLANLTTLDLSSCGIDGVGVTALASSPYLSRLKYLFLHENLITPKGAKALAAGQFPSLRTLEMSQNHLDGPSLRALVGAEWIGSLDYLGLSACRLSWNEVKILTSAESLWQLRALALSDNHVSGPGLKALFSPNELRFLSWLDLSHSGIDPSALESLPKTFGRVPSTLLLNRNELGDEGVELLAAWPGMNEVSELWLEDNEIGSAGARALAKSPNLEMLLILHLEDNSVGRSGKQALYERFGKDLVDF